VPAEFYVALGRKKSRLTSLAMTDLAAHTAFLASNLASAAAASSAAHEMQFSDRLLTRPDSHPIVQSASGKRVFRIVKPQ
jgi:hypothetical protein